MATQEIGNTSRLIPVLREGVAIVQMVFFKELRTLIAEKHPDMTKAEQAMLTGSVTNELFGTPNPEPKFVQFRQDNKATIEQELLAISSGLTTLRRYLTDALRVQTLCDSQEGKEETRVLENAEKIGVLLKDRDIPLPSVFMTLVRGLGQEYNLIIPPVQITQEDDESMVH